MMIAKLSAAEFAKLVAYIRFFARGRGGKQWNFLLKVCGVRY